MKSFRLSTHTCMLSIIIIYLAPACYTLSFFILYLPDTYISIHNYIPVFVYNICRHLRFLHYNFIPCCRHLHFIHCTCIYSARCTPALPNPYYTVSLCLYWRFYSSQHYIVCMVQNIFIAYIKLKYTVLHRITLH